MNSRQNDIPWKKIVTYHKEITRRSEEQFFSLFRKQDEPAKEWSFLSDDLITSLLGPWSIPLDSIESTDLLRRIRMNDVQELFIGGPLWVQNKKIFNSGWHPHVHPFFLKEVSFSIDDETLMLTPLEGNWEISPLAFKGLERSEMVAEEDAEEKLLKIISDSETEGDSLQLSRWVRQEILDRLPIFYPLFENRDSSNLRYQLGSWVLFTPRETGPISRHLLNDYKELESKVEEGIIGGLSLLGGSSHGTDKNEDEENHKDEVLPIVPLNTYQEKAVKGILKNKPVTVISGPPGCGKSQVVVSSILNAWSKGLSVLFASNNNQAVDVVKERLVPFENYIPIAVRAGASGKNTLEDDLRTTISHITNSSGNTENLTSTVQERISQLLYTRNKLYEFLDSKLPEQIEQGIQAASRAYGVFLKTREEIKVRREENQKVEEKLGLAAIGNESLEEACSEALMWEKSASPYIDKIESQRGEIAKIEKEIETNWNSFINIVSDIGIDTDTINDWSWVLRNEGPESLREWLKDAIALCETPIDTRLGPVEWSEEYDFWNSSAGCTEWMEQAENFIGEIQVKIAEVEPVVQKLKELDDEYSHYNDLIGNYGFPREWTCDKSYINLWSGYYAQFLSCEKTTLSVLPFSERSKAIRGMRKTEKHLRSFIPLSVWRKIGHITSESRDTLSEIMELLSTFLAIQEKWKEYSEKRKQSEEFFSDLRKKVAILGLEDVPSTLDISAWRKFKNKIQSKTKIASAAKKAWLLTEDRNEAMEEISELKERFFSISAGFPLRTAWIENEGKEFSDSLIELNNNPDSENLKVFRSQLYSSTLQKFLDLWDDCRNYLEKIEELKSKIDVYPPEEETVAQWLDEKPSVLPEIGSSFRTLPEENSNIYAWFREIEQFIEDYRYFTASEYPALQEKLDGEFEWAKKNILQVLDLIPGNTEKEELRERYTPYFNDKEADWPIQELIDTFRKFNTQWLTEQIHSVNIKLRDLTFEDAKSKWQQRVHADRELPSKLQSLLSHYLRNKKKIKEDGFNNYKASLCALPIWITTAQSPQSIPMLPEIFDLVIIDEATQCTLTNLLPLIFRGKRLVVIGDPEQLPAIPSITAGNERPLAAKFGVSGYLEAFGHDNNTVYASAARCLPGRHSDVVMLKEHYRSHPLIIGFSNLNIYQSMLKLRRDPKTRLNTSLEDGVSLVEVNGKASRGSGNRSWINKEEAEFIIEYLLNLFARVHSNTFTVGIVTPFRAQKEYIIALIDSYGLPSSITVGTAHAFQGDERDVILFSPVAAPGINPESLKWIEEPRNLINVAVTRARESFVLVGHIPYLRELSGILGKLASYITKIEDLRGSSKEELDLYSWMVLSGWNPVIREKIGNITVSLTLKDAGVNLAVIVGTPEAGAEELLAGYGYKTLVVEPRAVNETPALVLKNIAENLEFDVDNLLEMLPDSLRKKENTEDKAEEYVSTTEK